MSGHEDASRIAEDLLGLKRGVREGRIASLEGEDEMTSPGNGSVATRSKDSGKDRSNGGGESNGEKDAKILSAWQQGLAPPEMIDDPVRMYLREIGSVSLLKAAEERVLASKFESGKHILQLEDELTGADGRAPSAWQLVHEFMGRIYDAQALVEALSKYVGLNGQMTLNDVVSLPEMRDVLDGDMSEEMLQFLEAGQGKEVRVMAQYCRPEPLPEQAFEAF